MTCDKYHNICDNIQNIHYCPDAKRQIHYCVFIPQGKTLWDNKIVHSINTECSSKNVCMTNHAEINCLRSYKKIKDKPNRLDIIVIRLSKTGILGQSRPCHDCLKSLQKSGIDIRYVIYSTDNQKIIRERFCDMIKSIYSHKSSGFRYKNKQIINRIK
jgi:tRNA(Arg) A34 adenosine deaminase TadA